MKRILLVSMLGMFLCGCAGAQLSSIQRRNIEAKQFEGSFDNAFKATLAVLQDRGFMVKHTDYSAGVIQAETGVKRSFWTGRETKFTVSVTIEQFGENVVKERITFLKGRVVDAGQYGRSENSNIIEDPTLLQEIYNEIQKEIFVRQNLNK
ncbi:hypothetical protein KKC91_00885 [bacterium]|nr:hypothetical protein [bacterium]